MCNKKHTPDEGYNGCQYGSKDTNAYMLNNLAWIKTA